MNDSDIQHDSREQQTTNNIYMYVHVRRARPLSPTLQQTRRERTLRINMKQARPRRTCATRLYAQILRQDGKSTVAPENLAVFSKVKAKSCKTGLHPSAEPQISL